MEDSSENSSFEALNLILPSNAVEKCGEMGLKLDGYEGLKAMRDRTAEFRAGYKNWRKQGAKGSRGETKDVFSKALDGADTRVSNLLKKEGFERVGGGEGGAILPSTSQIPTVAISPAAAKSTAVVPHQTVPIVGKGEGWLKFFYNPLTPMDDHFERTLRLSCKALENISSPVILYPTYPRPIHSLLNKNGKSGSHSLVGCQSCGIKKSKVKNWILHVGVGGFHRSHQAVYLDELLSKQWEKEKTAMTNDDIYDVSWGLCGVGLLSFDEKMYNALYQQDFLYTVWTRASKISQPRIIGSIFDFFHVPDDDENGTDMKRVFLNEDVKIVSLTVTEKGYIQNVEGHLDTNNPGIVHDLSLDDIIHPKTSIGFIVCGLLIRFFHQQAPLTIQSCDNLPDNGHVAQRMVYEFISNLVTIYRVKQNANPAYISQPVEVRRSLEMKALKNYPIFRSDNLDTHHSLPELPEEMTQLEFLEKFKDWVWDNVKFPCSMVDRITPVTQIEHKQILLQDFGIDDEWPVVAEEFMQWVIEDKFCHNSRPNWETVGATMTDDILSYETMKLRLLNGGHSAMAYMSILSGHRFVDDAISDIHISSLLRGYMDEVTPTVNSGVIEIERYKEKIVERFGNRFIKDALSRIAEDGSTKFFSTMKEALIELLAKDSHVHFAALALAGYILYMTGIAEDVVIKDPKTELLQPLCRKAVEFAKKHTGTDIPYNLSPSFSAVSTVLEDMFGKDLGANHIMVSQVTLALIALNSYGARHVLKAGGALPALLAPIIACPDAVFKLLTLHNEHEKTSCSPLTAQVK